MKRLWSLLFFLSALSLWFATPVFGTPAATNSKSGWVDVKPRVVRKFPKRMIKMMRAMRKARMARGKSAARTSFKASRTAPALRGRIGVATAKSTFRDPIKQMNETQKARYQKWLERLMAPCCPNQILASHDSPKAAKARRDLQQRILRNETDATIRKAITQLYGEKIFSIPPHKDIIWFPIIGSMLILLILVFLIQRWNHRGQDSSSQEKVLSMEEQGEFLDD